MGSRCILPDGESFSSGVETPQLWSVFEGARPAPGLAAGGSTIWRHARKLAGPLRRGIEGKRRGLCRAIGSRRVAAAQVGQRRVVAPPEGRSRQIADRLAIAARDDHDLKMGCAAPAVL